MKKTGKRKKNWLNNMDEMKLKVINQKLYMRSKNIIALFFSLLGLAASAQRQPLTLNDAIAISLQNNYDIRLTRNDS